jgi:hypothetical protein
MLATEGRVLRRVTVMTEKSKQFQELRKYAWDPSKAPFANTLSTTSRANAAIPKCSHIAVYSGRSAAGKAQDTGRGIGRTGAEDDLRDCDGMAEGRLIKPRFVGVKREENGVGEDESNDHVVERWLLNKP